MGGWEGGRVGGRRVGGLEVGGWEGGKVGGLEAEGWEGGRRKGGRAGGWEGGRVGGGRVGRWEGEVGDHTFVRRVQQTTTTSVDISNLHKKYFSTAYKNAGCVIERLNKRDNS